MATIVTRSGKGSPLTNTEVDSNFSNLNTDKLEDITGESIKDLSDVYSAMSPTDGQVLTYDSTNGWQAEDATGGGGGLTFIAKTANYTASSGEGILADTSGGAFTVTLPASPSTGDQVVVADSGNSFATNNLTVARNSSTIADSAEDLVLDINDVLVDFIYDGSTWEFYTQPRAVITSVDTSLDGGFASSVYLISQSVNGGSASG